MIADRTVLGLDSQPIKFLLIQFRRAQNEPVPGLQRSRRERHHIEQSGGEFIAAPRHHRFANQVRQNPLPEAASMARFHGQIVIVRGAVADVFDDFG